ncbi:hypothetical protein RJT34_28113 [Clitoria ternatea]|uniref:Uncharacterized protein n=1 Tax=Clitoria ternatea TaxID=43366 RepID=A0AAN9FAP2_CLITE
MKDQPEGDKEDPGKARDEDEEETVVASGKRNEQLKDYTKDKQDSNNNMGLKAEAKIKVTNPLAGKNEQKKILVKAKQKTTVNMKIVVKQTKGKNGKKVDSEHLQNSSKAGEKVANDNATIWKNAVWKFDESLAILKFVESMQGNNRWECKC